MSHYENEREADDIWTKFPDGATHYGCGTYWRQAGFYWMKYQKGDFHRVTGSDNPFGFRDYSVRPQTHREPTIAEMEAEKRAEYNKRFAFVDATKTHQNAQEPTNKYSREIIGLDGKTCQVDVYRVLEAFEVDSHAIAHSIKKLLAPGKRHAKTREQDLKEAIKSIEAELLLMSQR